MADLQSEARAPVAHAPLSWGSKRLLSSVPFVQAVTVLAEDGKVLADERAPGYGHTDLPIDGGYTFVYQAPGTGLVFYIRMSEDPTSADLPAQIEAMIGSPSPVITRREHRKGRGIRSAPNRQQNPQWY